QGRHVPRRGQGRQAIGQAQKQIADAEVAIDDEVVRAEAAEKLDIAPAALADELPAENGEASRVVVGDGGEIQHEVVYRWPRPGRGREFPIAPARADARPVARSRARLQAKDIVRENRLRFAYLSHRLPDAAPFLSLRRRRGSGLAIFGAK